MMNIKSLIIFMVTYSFTQFTFAADTAKHLEALSDSKWEWMAAKENAPLQQLFHEDAKFVHMSGSWKTERELEIIKSGSIWYKKATIHDRATEIVGDTGIVWSRITLTAHVRGGDVENEFTVTEVFSNVDGDWKILGLTFSKVRDTHQIEH